MKECNTTCPYCGVGCGVRAEVEGAKVIKVVGDGDHPANAGRLCVKGTALAETLGDEGRLLHPQLAGERVSWNHAIDTIATKIRQTIETHGPESIAMYLSGQLLSEDYYVANKLMKGFLGSANVDTNSRLCMSSAVAAHKRAFGEDIVPCTYADLDTCDLLVMVGSNAAWTHPVVYQRIVAAKKDNPDKRIVVIDPRRTATCDIADLHLQIKPGSDAYVFSGLLNHLQNNSAIDEEYVARHTRGLPDTLAAIGDLDMDTVAESCGLDPIELNRFYSWYANTDRTVTMFSQGVKQSATGTDKCNAIINCHLATGRIGKSGAGPFSITGQPNAMGGREVGGLANQLAAHMDFSPAEIDRVQRFWEAPDMIDAPGLKAVDLFQAAADGKIKFLWIMATNPAVSLPDSDMVKRALERCEFVVVSDCTEQTDTATHADLLLPAAPWGEKDGTVTNSERVISRQRKLVAPTGEARPDWQIITDVAQRLGLKQYFDYPNPAAVFREHAALSGFENEGSRAFDIGALAQLSDEEYANMEPIRWPVRTNDDDSEPLADGRFYTADGRAKIVPLVPELPQAQNDITVNTGRLRDQWHSMTRTGRVPRLSQHRDFFSISVNPEDAAKAGLVEGDLAQLENSLGMVRGLVMLDPGIARGQSFIPIHWSEQFSTLGKVSQLIPAVTDPVSGQPQSKFSCANIAAVPVACWGMVFSKDPLQAEGIDYWSRIAVKGGYLTIIADGRSPARVAEFLKQALADKKQSVSAYSDAEHGDLREVSSNNGRISHALFLHPDRNALPLRAWLSTLADQTPGWELLAGFSSERPDTGKMICSCWEVGETEIVTAIAAGASSVEALGDALKCGTQCGSCIPELKAILYSEDEQIRNAG
ncbi:nitrate reductase [Halioglobus maricola]|uniref:Nitrate reductase n=1 Tax=Halioglobus maricola TaxID=2601894 RepID=A0A5P9NEX1_9GAMM|nr:nitrate reductase [Halioglobus maricola]QFU74291.1 nitrate reductase [Halioglobus maricola]